MMKNRIFEFLAGLVFGLGLILSGMADPGKVVGFLDLFGGGEFPAVDADGRVTLTLATQSFYWLHLGETGYQPAHL